MSSSIVIQNGILVAPNHPLHGSLVSIKISDGTIVEIGKEVSAANESINAQGGFISAGWCDVFSFLPDPGAEWKERLDTFAHAACLAGFTQSAVFAGIDPLPEKAASITALKQRSIDLPVEILPLGAASEGRMGKEMAEVNDMNSAGAIAQTDGITVHGSDSLRSKLLEYCCSLNIPYLVHPYNPKWVAGGQIHEGYMSVNLGLKGIPTVAETTALLADIEIAKWLNVPLRVLGISSKESLEIIKNARSVGVDIHVSVPFMNLCFSESDIDNFDERFKVMPPLRTQEDKEALLQGLLNGDVNAIFANHTPEDIENKKLEFEYAAVGAATYSGFIPKLFEMFTDEELLKVIDILSRGNRHFLGMPEGEIQVGQKASITVISRKASDHSQTKGSIAYNKLSAVMDQGGLVCTIRGTKINY